MRFRQLTRTKITIGAIVVIGVLTAIAVIPWDRFDGLPHEATVTPAAAAAKGERALESSLAGKYDWELSNCRERAEKSRFGHWRCDARTIEPPCHGYVLLDVFEEDHGKADIWHVQNRVKRCAPYGVFDADFTPDSDWE